MDDIAKKITTLLLCFMLVIMQFAPAYAQDESKEADGKAEPAVQESEEAAEEEDAKEEVTEEVPETEEASEDAAAVKESGSIVEDAGAKEKVSEETDAPDDTLSPAFKAQIIDTGCVMIIVDVPEGAFSEKVTARGSRVSSESVKDTIEQELGESAGSISAVDISFHTEDGTELEPLKPVTVRVNAYGIDAGSYRVVHIKDSGRTEVVASSDDSSFSFKTDSFSIYTIVGDDDGTVRRTYNFYNGDELVDTQIVKNGDKLVEPSVPSSGKEGEMFLGWSSDDGATFQEFDKAISDIDESADRDETVDLYACFDAALAVIFYDRHGYVLETVYGKTGDEVSVDDVEFELMAGEYVSGWTTSSDNTPEGAVSGSVTIIDKNIELYPIVENVHWIIFHDKDLDDDPSIPSHVDPYYLKEEEKTSKPEDPTRPGYDFGKWTTDEEGTDKFDFGNELTKDTVLYAQWDPEEAEYQLLVWEESLVNQQYVEGNYALSEHYTRSAPSGSEVTLTEEDPLIQEIIGKTAHRYHELSKIDGPAVVKGDGTTVLNIYLDLKVYKVEFRAMPEVYIRDGLYVDGGVFSYENIAIDRAYYYDNVYGKLSFTFDHDGMEYRDYDVYTIEARFGEDITSRWPDYNTGTWGYGEDATDDFKQSWDPVLEKLQNYEWMTNDINSLSHRLSGYATRQTNMAAHMINDDGSDTMHLWLYFAVNGDVKGANYWLENVGDSEYSRSEKYSQTLIAGLKLRAKQLDGFTVVGSATDPDTPEGYDPSGEYDGRYEFHFYYTRNRYPLRFYNYNKIEKEYTADEAIKYEAPLEQYDYTPNRPAALPDEYVFGGWYTTEQCFDGTEFSFDGAIMPVDGLTLYAKWAAPEYTVSFDSNGGTEVPSQTVDYGKQVMRPEAPVREGFTFGGWIKGSSPFNFNTEIYADTKLTARWLSDESIEIVYDAGEHGSKPPADENKYADVSRARIQYSPNVDDGYRFVGWKCGDDVYYPGSLFTVRSADAEKVEDKLYRITLHAVYEKDVPEVRVIYYRNHPGISDGDEAYALTEYMPNNDSIRLAKPGELSFEGGIKAPRGWHFLYWAEKPDGSGRHYEPGDIVAADFNGDNVLYAIWEADECTITYDPNGGIFRESKSPTDISVHAGDVITIAEAPTRKGYTFLYWEGSEYYPGDKYTVEGNHTFTAVWEKYEETLDPDNPSKPGPGRSGHTPKTGDASDISGLLSMMILCIIMLTGIELRRRKDMR